MTAARSTTRSFLMSLASFQYFSSSEAASVLAESTCPIQIRIQSPPVPESRITCGFYSSASDESFLNSSVDGEALFYLSLEFFTLSSASSACLL